LSQDVHRQQRCKVLVAKDNQTNVRVYFIIIIGIYVWKAPQRLGN
jgi:hypothetical protein